MAFNPARTPDILSVSIFISIDSSSAFVFAWLPLISQLIQVIVIPAYGMAGNPLKDLPKPNAPINTGVFLYGILSFNLEIF